MRRNSALATAVATLILVTAGSEFALGGDGEIKALHRVVSWVSADATHRGAHLMHIASDGLSNRLFFRSADGARLVLADRLDPRRGQLTWTLLDDRSGWWARLTADYGYRAETLNVFFAHYNELVDPSFGYRFETSGGAFVEGTLGKEASHDVPGSLLHRLTDEQLSARVSDAMPDDVRGAVLLLDTSLAGVGGATRLGEVIEGKSYQPLLELLALTLRQEDRALRPAPVPMLLDELHKGLAVPPAVESLLAEFEMVDGAQPMRQAVGPPIVDITEGSPAVAQAP